MQGRVAGRETGIAGFQPAAPHTGACCKMGSFRQTTRHDAGPSRHCQPPAPSPRSSTACCAPCRRRPHSAEVRSAKMLATPGEGRVAPPRRHPNVRDARFRQGSNGRRRRIRTYHEHKAIPRSRQGKGGRPGGSGAAAARGDHGEPGRERQIHARRRKRGLSAAVWCSGTSLAGRMLRPSKRRQALWRRQRQANCLRNS